MIPERLIDELRQAAGGPVLVLSLTADLDKHDIPVHLLSAEELVRIRKAARVLSDITGTELQRRIEEPVYPEIVSDRAKEGVQEWLAAPRPWEKDKQ